jgi:poly(A) polymerase
VTNARPEQVKSLFNYCRLIGRRFVLAHVHQRGEIIEVATFRAHHDKGEEGDGVTENGRIVRDNVYGTLDEDALRRDFTINALYYDISDFSVIDYANGLADLKAGVIRLIGDPVIRYQEDPVRMLRAARFAAKLGFSVEHESAELIPQLSVLLDNIPPARLFEEVQKLFLSGHATESFIQLQHYNLFKQLFPYTESCLKNSIAQAFIKQMLHNTDERIRENKPVMPAFLLAAFLWPALLPNLPSKSIKGTNQQEVWLDAFQKLLAKQQKYVSIPRRISVLIQEIWRLQLRLTRSRRGKNKCLSILKHPRFRAGYDFLLLRAQAGENNLAEEADWWTEFLDNHPQQKTSSVPTSVSHKKHLRRRKYKKKK